VDKINYKSFIINILKQKAQALAACASCRTPSETFELEMP